MAMKTREKNAKRKTALMEGRQKKTIQGQTQAKIQQHQNGTHSFKYYRLLQIAAEYQGYGKLLLSSHYPNKKKEISSQLFLL